MWKLKLGILMAYLDMHLESELSPSKILYNQKLHTLKFIPHYKFISIDMLSVFKAKKNTHTFHTKMNTEHFLTERQW